MSTELEITDPETPHSAEIVPYSDAHVFDLADVKQRVDAIHRIMAKQMKANVHYGVIPGTKKPTLYKPGSEILLLTFRVAIDPEITDLSTPNEIRYRIRAIGRHVPTDSFMGAGVGECSSNEEKFLWRSALSREEYEATPDDQKRIKFKKEWDRGRPGIVKVEQIKVPPADAANAVLKRAKKRAQVDFCLTAMAASEIFTQDVEDLPDGYLDENESPASAPEQKINQAQVTELRKSFDRLSEPRQRKALEHFKLDIPDKEPLHTALANLGAREYNNALKTLAKAVKNDGTVTITDEQEASLTAVIEGIGGSCKSEFLKANRIKRLSELTASQYSGAMAALEQQRRK